jgi:hypothetical protein
MAADTCFERCAPLAMGLQPTEQAADSKRRVQKKENSIFDIKPASKMNFGDLTAWYLDMEKVKTLSSYRLIGLILKKFN